MQRQRKDSSTLKANRNFSWKILHETWIPSEVVWIWLISCLLWQRVALKLFQIEFSQHLFLLSACFVIYFPAADSTEYHFTGLSEEQIWWYCSSVLLSWRQSTSEPYFLSLLHNTLGIQMTPSTLWASVIAIIMYFLTYLCVWFSVLPHYFKLLTSHIMSIRVFSHKFILI